MTNFTKRHLWTIGHSNRSSDQFLQILLAANIQLIADVRRFPGSRRHPHFGQEALRVFLAAKQIGYQHFAELGGRRTRRAVDSPNTGWRVEAFNAFADYMMTDEFLQGLARLEHHSEYQRTAIMCSEALPWQCHRRLIADALLVRDWEVEHLIGEKRSQLHTMTEFARCDGDRIVYPKETLF
jgi:uncharacterized protein (DUF488 family)